MFGRSLLEVDTQNSELEEQVENIVARVFFTKASMTISNQI